MRTRTVVSLAATVLLAALGGCSAYPDGNGRIALGRSGGHTVVLLDVCHGSTDEIHVSADRQGLRDDETNPVLGQLRTATPVTGRAVVDLDSPGPQWQTTAPVQLPTEGSKGVIVIATGSDGATEMTQADALVAQLHALKPGQVIVMGGEVMTEAQFHARACTAQG